MSSLRTSKPDLRGRLEEAYRGTGFMAVLLVMAVGLGLRLWQIDLTQFDLDQSTLLGHAAAFVASGQLPQTSGLSFTIGIRHPPLITFLLAPPLLFTRDPVWVSAYQAALDACGAIFVWMAARDLGGRRAGLIAGLLYAVSPAAELFSRRIWNADWVPLFSALALWGAVGFARFGDPRRLAASLFGLACAAQLHPTAGVLFLPILALAAARRRDVTWRPLAVAGVALVLLLLPYLRLQVESGWQDVQAVAGYLAAPKTVAPEVAYQAASLIVGNLWTQAAEDRDLNWSLLLEPAALLIALLTAFGAYVAIGLRSGGWAVLTWLLLPILASVRSVGWVEPHYLLVVLPAAALLAGLGLAALRPQPLGTGLLVALVLWRGVDNVRFQQSVAALDLETTYGVPLRYTLEAARQLVLRHDGTQVFVGYPHAYGGMFHYLTQDGFPITHFDSEDSLILRPAGGRYLVKGGGLAEVELANRFGSPLARVGPVSGQAAYVLHLVTPREVAPDFVTPPILSPIDADIGNLVRLLGYQLGPLTGGQPTELMLAWEVGQADDPRWPGLIRSVELRDASGRRWSIESSVEALLTSDRRAGDLVVSRAALVPLADVPTGGYWLELAFVEATDHQRLRVYAGMEDIGDAVRIGPVKVAGVGLAAVGADSVPHRAVFGDGEVALLSAQLDGSSVRIRWGALVKPADAYTVFVHGLDAEGRVVAQHDGPPVGGMYPTNLWDRGEIIEDVHPLAGDLGQVRSLAIGLYRRPSLERLPAKDTNGASLGDHVLIYRAP